MQPISNTSQIIEEITKLTYEWYKLIGPSHHKDIDCHWYVETRWSYGDQPKYFVRHDGYILRDVIIESNSYEESLRELEFFLRSAINQEKEFIESIKNENDEW